jgi:hypothetical protein
MGQMRFYAPTQDALLPHAVAQAYIAGIEAIPWHGCNRWTDGTLSIDRAVSDSGSLHIPWDVPGHGQLVLSTCTLMERSEPYHLAVELARGTLHRARTLVADLASEDVVIPGGIREELKQALSTFFRAATAPACAETEALRTIRVASNVIARVCQDVVLGQINVRRAAQGPLPALLVGRLANGVVDQQAVSPFLSAFHAASLPFRWRDLQPTVDAVQYESVDAQLAWCDQHGLRVLGGPLIQLDRGSLPEWVFRWENGYEAFEDAARKYVRGVVRRYDEAVDVWVCAGRLNVADALAFSEEQRLRLAVSMIDVVRESSSHKPVVISFDQPWAEYLATDDYDLSPLHFADALVRAELGLGGIALEMNLGYWPGGCLPRDLLAISRHVDRWSLLGIPLIVYLTMPSSVDDDPQAVGNSRVVHRNGGAQSTPAMDQGLASHLVPLLLGKPAVHALVWNQLSDVEPHEFPHSGLLDRAGNAKPLLSVLGDIRKKLLA